MGSIWGHIGSNVCCSLLVLFSMKLGAGDRFESTSSWKNRDQSFVLTLSVFFVVVCFVCFFVVFVLFCLFVLFLQFWLFALFEECRLYSLIKAQNLIPTLFDYTYAVIHTVKVLYM